MLSELPENAAPPMIPTMITRSRTMTAPAAPSAAIMDCTVFAAASTAALAALKVFSPALAVFCIRRTPSEVCKAAFFTDGGAVLIVRRCMVFGSNCFRGFSLIRMVSGCFWRMAFCLAVSPALLFWFCLLMESDPPSDISCPFWILGVSLAARIFCSFVLTASETAFCRWAF